MKTTKELSPQLKETIAIVAIVGYAAFAHFLASLLLDAIIPRFMPTSYTSKDFGWFGVIALGFGGAAFALFKGSREPEFGSILGLVMKAIGIILEGIVFISAVAIWKNAGQYAALVGQFNRISANFAMEVRYWMASVIFLNGIAGNLLVALLLH